MSEKDLATMLTHKNANPHSVYLDMLLKARQHWSWFAISYIICTLVALIYLRYTTPRYQVTASVLIRDESRGGDLGDGILLEQLGIPAMKSSIDNEVEILKSRSLMESVVKDLQLHVRYLAEGRFKVTDLYEKSPYQLTLLNSSLPDQSTTYRLHVIDKNRYQLSGPIQVFNGRFQDTIALPQGKAILTRTHYQPSVNDNYLIVLSSGEETVRKYSEALTISATNKLASIVDLSLTDELPAKAEALLTRLLYNYLQMSIMDKNRVADSTIVFINRNLGEVSGELASIEEHLEQFRTKHQIVSPAEHAKLLLESFSQYEGEENRLLTRLEVLETLYDALQENRDLIIPSSLFQQAMGFAEQAKSLGEARLLRQKTLQTVPESSPLVTALDIQIDELKRDLTEGIYAQRLELQVNIESLKRYRDSIQTKISTFPALEKTNLDFSRQQQIKQELYLFLLKKKVETAISRSSAIANGRVIDSPKTKSQPTSPSRQLVLLISALISIAIPATLLQLKGILNDRISDKSEVLAHCNVPILAGISYEKHFLRKTFGSDRRGIIAEQFRTLRTNIQFSATDLSRRSILITSSMGGEGKSFIAVNLCHSLSLAGKKVILAELDLRKPILGDFLGLSKSGFSELLASGGSVADYIQQCGGFFTFDVITSGHPPPNPVEMLALPKMKEIICSLRDQYDYIIFDTPPIGLVTDARIIGQFADLSLYVLRQHFTFKHQLEDINPIVNEGQLPCLNLILNGIKHDSRYQYDYGYELKKPNWRNTLWSKFKSHTS